MHQYPLKLVPRSLGFLENLSLEETAQVMKIKRRRFFSVQTIDG